MDHQFFVGETHTIKNHATIFLVQNKTGANG